MTTDLNRQICNIEYNYINLPSRVDFLDGIRVLYTYDANGTKLRTDYYINPMPVVAPQAANEQGASSAMNLRHTWTDYCGNFIYENDTLKQTLIEDGYISYDIPTSGTNVSQLNPKYHFYVQDHLGNNRLVVDESGAIEQVNHYYPFGGLMGESKNISSNQRYKYNGKEFDRMHSLDWYDYGARFYDPATGRWFSVDQLAEKYKGISPYVYCANDPVNLIDLIGEEPTDAEAARIAAHVYGDKKDDILIGGWRVSKRDFRISLSDQYGLKSQVYEKVEHGKVTEYVYATAGTEDGNDWKQNVLQSIGLSAQYKHAAENAKIISNVLKSTEVNFVGHSLGGGEAALNSLVTSDCGYEGRKAFTFNAAGVGSITKMLEGGLRASLKSEGKINAYILTTDPLNNIQNIHPAMPNVNGVRHYLMPKDFSSVINGHSINSILKNFGVDPKRYSK